jgi:integration host factor subunit beta
MTKSELVEALARQRPDLPKRDVEIVVDTLLVGMFDALKRHDRIEVRGFGTFVARLRRAREGRNPLSKQKVLVPAKRVPFFTCGKELRERINNADGAKP